MSQKLYPTHYNCAHVFHQLKAVRKNCSPTSSQLICFFGSTVDRLYILPTVMLIPSSLIE